METWIRDHDHGTRLSGPGDASDRHDPESGIFDPDAERGIIAELLEHVPGVDAQVASRQLAEEFGTLAAASAASPHRLLKACLGNPGPVSRLFIFRRAMLHVLNTQVRSGPIVSSSASLLAYLRTNMGLFSTETVRVLHLNSRNMLIRDEVVARGTVDAVTIYTREIIARALELGSSGLILAHNHPGGDPTPSPEDVGVTKALATAAAAFDIELCDHVIVAAQGVASMRRLRLL